MFRGLGTGCTGVLCHLYNLILCLVCLLGNTVPVPLNMRPLFLFSGASFMQIWHLFSCPIICLSCSQGITVEVHLLLYYPLQVSLLLGSLSTLNSSSQYPHGKLKECIVWYHMIHTTFVTPVQALYFSHPPLMPAIHVHHITLRAVYAMILLALGLTWLWYCHRLCSHISCTVLTQSQFLDSLFHCLHHSSFKGCPHYPYSPYPIPIHTVQTPVPVPQSSPPMSLFLQRTPPLSLLPWSHTHSHSLNPSPSPSILTFTTRPLKDTPIIPTPPFTFLSSPPNTPKASHSALTSPVLSVSPHLLMCMGLDSSRSPWQNQALWELLLSPMDMESSQCLLPKYKQWLEQTQDAHKWDSKYYKVLQCHWHYHSFCVDNNFGSQNKQGPWCSCTYGTAYDPMHSMQNC